MSLSPQWLDGLRARVTLSAVIGRNLRLTKAGREFHGLCPFHNEKTPSFTVNDEKGFYHCFGCGAHGDAIRWLTDQRGLDFMTAVRTLAEEAGMELPALDPHTRQRTEAQAGLHEVMAAAQAWYVAELASPRGAGARAYLARRGIDADTQSRFGFGYAPPGRQALKSALGQFSEALLTEAGLRIAPDRDADGPPREPYDRFRDRLMLPIHDARGRVIGFGGRILDATKTDAPKYLNSPDTPLFDKGRQLYNLHRAAPFARSGGPLIVVEGYMDVVALSTAGFGACVAPLGTALTEAQLALLWRQATCPVLCFDGDAAGQRAAMRACLRALPLLRPGASLAIARLPAGLDPDDLVRGQGPAAFAAVVSAAHSLLDVLWEHERDALPLTTPEAKAGLKARLMAHVETIADSDIRALYRRELLDRFTALAFPRRESAAMAPGDGPNAPMRWRRGAPPPPPQPFPETLAQLTQPAGDAMRAARGAAIAWGLARFPSLIAAQAEHLHVLSQRDRAIEALLAHAERGGALATAAITPILREQRLIAPEDLRRQGLGYRFLDEGDDAARAELIEAIALLAERTVLEAAHAEAQRRYEAELSDAAREATGATRAALGLLDKRELEMRERLRHMAQARTEAETKLETPIHDQGPATRAAAHANARRA